MKRITINILALCVLLNVEIFAQTTQHNITISIVEGKDTLNKTNLITGKQGKWVTFKNKKIVEIVYYKDNKKNGLYYSNEGGNIFIGKYLNDKLVDTLFHRTSKGKLKSIKIFDKDGNLKEFIYDFYSNGQARSITKYFRYNGFDYPYHLWFYRNGKPKIITEIIDSDGHEKTTYYKKDGSIQKVTN